MSRTLVILLGLAFNSAPVSAGSILTQFVFICPALEGRNLEDITAEYRDRFENFKQLLNDFNERQRVRNLTRFLEHLPANEEEWATYHEKRLVAKIGRADPAPRFLGPLMELDGISSPSLPNSLDSWAGYERKETKKENGRRAGYYLQAADGTRIPADPKSHYEDIRPFHDGVAQVLETVGQDRDGDNIHRWHLINTKGERVSEKQWGRWVLDPFQDGYAKVKGKDDTSWFIDTTGTRSGSKKWPRSISSVTGGVVVAFSRDLDSLKIWTPQGQEVALEDDPKFLRWNREMIYDELGGVISIPGFTEEWHGHEIPDENRINFRGIDRSKPKMAAENLIELAYYCYGQVDYSIAVGGPDITSFLWPERVEWLAAEAKGLNPGNAYVHKIHGWCLVNSGHHSRALEEFQTSIDLREEGINKDLRAGLLIAHWYLGNKDEARSHYTELLALEPNYGRARWLAELDWTDREKQALRELQEEN